MPYSDALAERIRDALGARSDLTERKMFGGIAFMVGGNMAVGVVGENLMVRLGPDAERALAEPHVRPMDFTGKPSKSMIYVDAAGIESDADLASWVEAGADYAASLDPKPKK